MCLKYIFASDVDILPIFGDAKSIFRRGLSTLALLVAPMLIELLTRLKDRLKPVWIHCKLFLRYKFFHEFAFRYNMERLSNDLNRVARLINWREPILEGYFPKLDSVVANRVWPSRPAYTTLNVIFWIVFYFILYKR